MVWYAATADYKGSGRLDNGKEWLKNFRKQNKISYSVIWEHKKLERTEEGHPWSAGEHRKEDRIAADRSRLRSLRLHTIRLGKWHLKIDLIVGENDGTRVIEVFQILGFYYGLFVVDASNFAAA